MPHHRYPRRCNYAPQCVNWHIITGTSASLLGTRAFLLGAKDATSNSRIAVSEKPLQAVFTSLFPSVYWGDKSPKTCLEVENGCDQHHSGWEYSSKSGGHSRWPPLAMASTQIAAASGGSPVVPLLVSVANCSPSARRPEQNGAPVGRGHASASAMRPGRRSCKGAANGSDVSDVSELWSERLASHKKSTHSNKGHRWEQEA